ncbi:flavodoxin family protein [Candidatus Pacearchaeota archaeon]|jgi:multimeric flavodoxin WrbA|nr:flavodoxin family protein [Candidatus Pacearchaeota archaeon]
MKVVIVQASYHRKGYTSSLVDEFKKGVKSVNKNADIEVFNLLDSKVEFCTGCIQCSHDKSLKIGKCPIKDDVRGMLEKLVDADVVVFATPLYDFGPTALLKRFMERCVPMTYWDPYPKARLPKKKGKYGVVLISAACPDPYNDLLLMTAYPRAVLSLYTRGFGCSKAYIISAGGMPVAERYNTKWKKRSYDLGVKIARKFKN